MKFPDFDTQANFAARELQPHSPEDPDYLSRFLVAADRLDRIWDLAKEDSASLDRLVDEEGLGGTSTLDKARRASADTIRQALGLPKSAYVAFVGYDDAELPEPPQALDHGDFRAAMRRQANRGMYSLDTNLDPLFQSCVVRPVEFKDVRVNDINVDVLTIAVPWQNEAYETFILARQSDQREAVLDKHQMLILHRLLHQYDTLSHDTTTIASLRHQLSDVGGERRLAQKQRDSLLRMVNDASSLRLPIDYPRSLEPEIAPRVHMSVSVDVDVDERYKHGIFSPHGLPLPAGEFASFNEYYGKVVDSYLKGFERLLTAARKFDRTRGKTDDVWGMFDDAPSLYLVQGSGAVNELLPSKRKKIEALSYLQKIPALFGSVNLEEVLQENAGRFANTALAQAAAQAPNATDQQKLILTYFNDAVDKGMVFDEVAEVAERRQMLPYVLGNLMEVMQLIAIGGYLRLSPSFQGPQGFNEEKARPFFTEIGRRVSRYRAGHHFLICSEQPMNLAPNESAVDPKHRQNLLFYDGGEGFRDYCKILQASDAALSKR